MVEVEEEEADEGGGGRRRVEEEVMKEEEEGGGSGGEWKRGMEDEEKEIVCHNLAGVFIQFVDRRRRK